MAPEERVEATLELEWPIEGLEPLSFVFGRLFDPICERLERRDRAVAVLHVRLRLVTRETHERSLQLPAPVRDPRALRTLALLALEAHPPPAAIDAVTIAIDPTPARVWRYSLWARARPSPEELSTLLARLTALMGEGRSGAPALVDSRRPGAFAMTPCSIERDEPSGRRRTQSFNAEAAEHFSSATSVLKDPESRAPSPESRILPLALRRFRIPVPARVAVEHGRPVRVTTDRRGLSGGRVEVCAGPWRTSGEWWRSACGEGWRPTGAAPRAAPLAPWNRDEWDVALADGSVCRIFRDRDEDRWYLEGIVD
jgi:protein ImuB